MTRWQNLWLKIIEPSEYIVSRDEREQASLQAAVIFIGIIFTILLLILIFVIPVIEAEIAPVLVVNLVIYAGLYALNRSIYYRWSARFFLWISVGFIFYSASSLVSENNIPTLDFLVIPIMVSGLILPHREAVVNSIITMMLATILIAVNDNFVGDAINVNLLLIFVGSISIIASILVDRYRKQALDNENRFRSLMQANHEGILFIDGETAKILDANPAAERVFGYSEEELIGRYPIEFIAPDDKAIIRNAWEYRTEDVPIEMQIIHKEGHEISIEARLRRHRYDDDKIYVLTILNISERKQIEAFIIESEERFRAIFNESVHYIGVLDASGKILEFNDRAMEKFGLETRHIIGKSLHEFDNWSHSEKSKKRTQDVIDKATQGEASRYEIHARDKNNQPVYLDFSVKPIVDMKGTTQIIIVESRDITEQRLAETKSREFEQRYETLFNNTTDAVFIFDMEGLITEVNQQAEKMLQASREGIVGHTVFDFVADEEAQKSANILAGMREGNQVSSVSERLMRRATGEIFYSETLGLLVTDDDNKPLYVQSMVRDISERKKADAERFQTALESERTQLLAHFIENASHHFRTPITNMKARMYLLPRVLDNPAKRDEQIDVLNQNLQRLQNILSDLLMILRLQKDDTEYTPDKIPVNLLLSEVRQNFEGRAEYNQHNWTWQLDAQNPLLFGDKGLLAQALINIIENAIIYTPQGKAITIYNYSHNNYVIFDIIDGGHGISKDEMPHIFEDFFRGQESMQEDSSSSGLGLTIVRTIVNRYQGKIFVASPEKGGAHFQIILPVYTENETDFSEMPSEMLKISINLE